MSLPRPIHIALVHNAPKQPQRSRDPIDTQEHARSYIAPRHVIPAPYVPEIVVPHPNIGAVDVSEIGTSDDEEVVACDLRVRCKCAEDCKSGEEEEDIAELERHDHRSWGYTQERNVGWHLGVVVLLGRFEDGVGTHNARVMLVGRHWVPGQSGKSIQGHRFQDAEKDVRPEGKNTWRHFEVQFKYRSMLELRTGLTVSKVADVMKNTDLSNCIIFLFM